MNFVKSEGKDTIFQGCGSGSGCRGKKTKKFQWKNALFSYLNKNFTTEKV
jgi:hypothetical protein